MVSSLSFYMRGGKDAAGTPVGRFDSYRETPGSTPGASPKKK